MPITFFRDFFFSQTRHFCGVTQRVHSTAVPKTEVQRAVKDRKSMKMKDSEKFKKLAEQVMNDVANKKTEEPAPNSDIILVLYFAAGNMSMSKLSILAKSAAEGLKSAIPEARLVVIPTRDDKSRLECINPRLAEPEEKARVLELIEKVDTDFQEFLRSVNLQEKSEESTGNETQST